MSNDFWVRSLDKNFNLSKTIQDEWDCLSGSDKRCIVDLDYVDSIDTTNKFIYLSVESIINWKYDTKNINIFSNDKSTKGINMNIIDYDTELKNTIQIDDIRLLQIYNALKIENISFELFKNIILGSETKATTNDFISYKPFLFEHFNKENKSTIPQSSEDFIKQRKQHKAFYKSINNKKVKKWE